MGGSGRGWFPSQSRHPERARDEFMRGMIAQAQASGAGRDADDYTIGLLAAANARDEDAVSRHLSELHTAVQNKLGETVDLRFGGSVAKHTYVEGLSDVDVLVCVDPAWANEHAPEVLQRHFLEAVRQRLPNSKVEAGRLAVTVRYADGCEIQLLPACRVGNHFKISDGSGGWVTIQPKEFHRQLSAANASVGGRLVPAVKLAKLAIATNAGTQGVRSHHLEAMAVDAVREYDGPRTPRALLMRVVEHAARAILTPLADPSKQSRHLDDYLGPAGSVERLRASAALQRLHSRMRAAEASGVDDWKSIFGDD